MFAKVSRCSSGPDKEFDLKVVDLVWTASGSFVLGPVLLLAVT